MDVVTITSVSVSEAKSYPWAFMRARIGSWFSTMPLCTMPTSSPSRLEKWGCAFASVGAPCVAQRVWDKPVVACTRFLRASSARCATRPVERSRSRCPSRTNAMPVES